MLSREIFWTSAERSQSSYPKNLDPRGNSVGAAFSLPCPSGKQTGQGGQKRKERLICVRKNTFVAAMKNSSKEFKSKEILDALNEAFSEAEEPEEIDLREKGKKYLHKKILKEEPQLFDYRK